MFTYWRTIRLAPSGSRAELKRGNSASARTQARMMNASGVSLTPAPCALSFKPARSCSSSVMSASSNCVTWGMLTQLACRRGPDILWIRDNGSVLTGPYCAKSTAGTAGKAVVPGAAVAAAAVVADGVPESDALTKLLMSSWVMRLLKPCPLTRARSTPSSRAKARTEGLACARENPGSSMAARSAR